MKMDIHVHIKQNSVNLPYVQSDGVWAKIMQFNRGVKDDQYKKYASL
jgi:hypothetical protein